MVWQGPRIRLEAETGTQVIITALSTILFRIACLLLELFLSLFPCFSSPRRPFAGVFLFFVLLRPCSSFFFLQPFGSSCAICILCHFRIHFVLFYCLFLFSIFWLWLVFVVLSYPVRWHFTCFP